MTLKTHIFSFLPTPKKKSLQIINTIFSKEPSEILKQEFFKAVLGHLKEKILKGMIRFFCLYCFMF